jgi:hypothetical protein
MCEQIQDRGLLAFLKDFTMESNELNFEEMLLKIEDQSKVAEVISVRRYKDAIYFGELGGDGKRSGKGVMVYNTGRRFEGTWQDDLRHGRGFERHPNRNYYQGQFLKGKAFGHGKYKWFDGGEYDG